MRSHPHHVARAPPPSPVRQPISAARVSYHPRHLPESRPPPRQPPSPPSPASMRTGPRRPPFFPLSSRATELIVLKTTPTAVPSLFHPFPSHPRPSHWSRVPPSQAKLPIALPSTRAPLAVRIWLVPPLSSLSSVRSPPSLSSLNPQPLLTSLSSFDPQGASPIARDHRRPPVSLEHPELKLLLCLDVARPVRWVSSILGTSGALPVQHHNSRRWPRST
jgi:hypothetical protein